MRKDGFEASLFPLQVQCVRPHNNQLVEEEEEEEGSTAVESSEIARSRRRGERLITYSVTTLCNVFGGGRGLGDGQQPRQQTKDGYTRQSNRCVK
jgi:hypothetical protein